MFLFSNIATSAFDHNWTKSDEKLLFANVILRLGGMHLLISFVSTIGTWTGNSDLADIMADIFGGVAVAVDR